MNINIDYKIKQKEGEDKIDNREVTFNYISGAVNQKYDKGLEGQLRRIWGRIQNKFDNAIESKEDEITLEQAEIDFIKKSFSEAKFHPTVSRYILILEEEIEKLGK